MLPVNLTQITQQITLAELCQNYQLDAVFSLLHSSRRIDEVLEQKGQVLDEYHYPYKAEVVDHCYERFIHENQKKITQHEQQFARWGNRWLLFKIETLGFTHGDYPRIIEHIEKLRKNARVAKANVALLKTVYEDEHITFNHLPRMLTLRPLFPIGSMVYTLHAGNFLREGVLDLHEHCISRITTGRFWGDEQQGIDLSITYYCTDGDYSFDLNKQKEWGSEELHSPYCNVRAFSSKKAAEAACKKLSETAPIIFRPATPLNIEE
jgi:hypothetical protein